MRKNPKNSKTPLFECKFKFLSRGPLTDFWALLGPHKCLWGPLNHDMTSLIIKEHKKRTYVGPVHRISYNSHRMAELREPIQGTREAQREIQTMHSGRQRNYKRRRRRRKMVQCINIRNPKVMVFGFSSPTSNTRTQLIPTLLILLQKN